MTWAPAKSGWAKTYVWPTHFKKWVGTGSLAPPPPVPAPMGKMMRVVNGCRQSTTAHAVMVEAGLALVAERCTSFAAQLLAKASAPPEGDLLRRVAEADPLRDCRR